VTSFEIKNLRQRLGWSVADLARRLSCSVDYLLQLEAGRAAPSESEAEQFHVLSSHLNDYNDQLKRAPTADVALDRLGFEQIHRDRLS
jgi:ribosome-binding protein aMBF1 (putative translation factor)